jgi:hypothetical protein
MIRVHRKIGWVLNPSDDRVNLILESIENNNGRCPSSYKCCPCTDYIDEDTCKEGLYLKIMK